MGSLCDSPSKEKKQIPPSLERQRPDASIRQQSEKIQIQSAHPLDALMVPWSYNGATNSDAEILWI